MARNPERFAITHGPEVVLRHWRHAKSGWRFGERNIHLAKRWLMVNHGIVVESDEEVIEIFPVFDKEKQVIGWVDADINKIDLKKIEE